MLDQNGVAIYPWSHGETLTAAALNAAIAQSTGASVGAAPPLDPGIGTLWYNPASGAVSLWDGTQWIVPTGLPIGGGTLTGPLYYTATGGTTSRAAQDRAADVVNVRDYGATGNGTTDDTIAIQAALNSGASLKRTVYVPSGTYLQSASLNYPAGLPGIRGDGRDATVIIRSPNTAGYQITATNIDGVRIRDLTLSGAATGQTNASAGMVLTGCSRITIERCSVSGQYQSSGYGWGIYISNNTDTTTASVVRDCVCNNNAGPGIQVYGTINNLAILGNHCLSNTQGGISLTVPNSPSANMTQRVLVAGNHCVGNGAGIMFLGIQAGFIRNVQNWAAIANNIVTDNPGYGISWQGSGASITGNQIYRNGTNNEAGILLNGNYCTVSGNTIDSNRGFGIDAGGGAYNTISANVISNTLGPGSGGGGAGLNLGAAQHCIITGNTFTANGVSPVDGGSNIGMTRYDSGGVWPSLPPTTDDILISNNKFNLAPGSTAWGIIVYQSPDGVVIKNNSFSGGSSSIYCMSVSANRCVIQGNTYEGAFGGEPTPALAGITTFADYADTILLTGVTRSITGVQTRSMNGQIGKINPILTAPGSGYTAAFAAGVSGDGTGFAATANLNGPAPAGVGGFTVSNQGANYTTATLTLSGPGGSGATATAQIGIPNQMDGRTIRLINTSGNPQTFVNGPTLALAGGVNRTLQANGSITLLGINGVMTEMAATGTQALVLGPTNNTTTAAGVNTLIVGGSNTISGNAATVFIAGSNTAVSNSAVLAAGGFHTVSGQYAVALGVGNTVSGMYSVGIGHGTNDIGRIGVIAHTSSQISAAGDCQRVQQTLRATTTTATPVVATADGNAAGVGNVFNAGNFICCNIRIRVVARNTASGAGACWVADNVLQFQGSGAASATLSPVTFTQGGTSGTVTGWAVSAAADTTNGGIAVSCTGAASATIHWAVLIESIEVK